MKKTDNLFNRNLLKLYIQEDMIHPVHGGGTFSPSELMNPSFGFIRRCDLWGPQSDDMIRQAFDPDNLKKNIVAAKSQFIRSYAGLVDGLVDTSDHPLGSPESKEVFQRIFAFVPKMEAEVLWRHYLGMDHSLRRDATDRSITAKNQFFRIVDFFTQTYARHSSKHEQAYACLQEAMEKVRSSDGTCAYDMTAADNIAMLEKACNAGVDHRGRLKELRDKCGSLQQMSRVAREQLECFWHHYDGLPKLLKTLCEFEPMNVFILSRTMQRTSGQMLGKNDVKISLAYDVNRRYRYQENVSLLIEEFIHAIDDRLNPAFTETKAWQKAVGLDVTGYKKNKAAERLVNFNNKVQSKNNTVFRWFHEKHPHMYIEALVDVANIEFILFDKMLRDGNLTKLGFSPDDTVDTVMNEAFPNMWKLYRGVKPDQHMVQNQKGDVLTLNQEEKVVHPAGATLNGQEKNVVSFLSLCKHRAEGLTGQVVEVDPLPLPGNALAPDPKSRVRRPRRR